MQEIIKQHILSLIESGMTTGIALTYGNNKKNVVLTDGFCESEGINTVNENTVFDLASVTKLFLTFAYFKASEDFKIDFDKKISFYCGSRFPNIQNITLNELFHFECDLLTRKRITNCCFEEAWKQIFEIRSVPYEMPKYSDMSSIVLGIAFKDIFSIDFGVFVEKEIIEKYHLSNTFWGKNQPTVFNYMDYSNEMVIKNGLLTIHPQVPLVVNDRKADILSDNGKYLSGNAGLFSTAKDIKTFCEAILSRDFLSDDSLKTIATKSNISFNQRFGYLSYAKSPNERISEVYRNMSDLSFAISGFTGTYLMIDPVNNCYLFIGGNRLNNKVTFVDDLSLVKSPNLIIFEGNKYFYSKDYVYMKDELRNSCCKDLLE